MKAEDWDRKYGATDRLWSIGPNRFVEEELAALPPGRALDLATGEGRNAVWLAERGWDVHAVDFSRVALERGEALAKERGVRVRFDRQDLLAWEPPAEAYDLVLVSYLQLPWAQMERVLGAAARAVAGAGTFFLIGHDRENLEHGTGGPPDPSVLYGPDDVRSLLDGFEIEKAERVRRPVKTDAGERDAIDCLVRAVRRCDT